MKADIKTQLAARLWRLGRWEGGWGGGTAGEIVHKSPCSFYMMVPRQLSNKQQRVKQPTKREVNKQQARLQLGTRGRGRAHTGGIMNPPCWFQG